MSDEDFDPDYCPFPGNFRNLLEWARKSGWLSETRDLIGELSLSAWRGFLVHVTSERCWQEIENVSYFIPDASSLSSLGCATYFFFGTSALENLEALDNAGPYYRANPRWPEENAVIVSGFFESQGVLDLRTSEAMRVISTFRDQVLRLQLSFNSEKSIDSWKKPLPPKVFECAIWQVFPEMFPELRGFLADFRASDEPLKDKELRVFASFEKVSSSSFSIHAKMTLVA